MSRELPTGIRRVEDGYQTYVWVKDPTHPKGGSQKSHRWDRDATISEMKAWRMKVKLGVLEDEPLTTFADDAHDYLQRDKVQRMPTKDQRIQHIDEWIAVFGRRDRHSIEPKEIQKALDGMRAKLSAGSVNKRRTALMDLWTTLDSRAAANPVKATTQYEEPEPEPRAPAMALVLKILKAMPTKTEHGRKNKARLQVIAWTGWPHAILKKVEPEHLDLKNARAFVTRRRKGKGSPSRWLPLLPETVKALRYFDQEDAYGPFSNSNLHKRLMTTLRALRKDEHLREDQHVRPYDFRHFFGTLIATVTKDERAVQELMLLKTVEQARRYTAAATDPRVMAAVAEVAEQLPGLLKAAGRIGRVSRASEAPNEPERKKAGRKPARKH